VSVDVFNDRDRAAAHGYAIYDAGAFCVSDGVNLGDPISDATDLVLDDCYTLTPGAKRWRLAMSMTDGLDRIRIGEGSEVGRIGAPLFIDCCCTFMAPDGTTLDALVLVELEPDSNLIAAVYLLPMGEFISRTDYALVAIDTENGYDRMAEFACVSFARGTRITLADGAQRPVEDLKPGDKVLTRQNGVQEIRWIGHRTERASGAFAPIIIKAGALHNGADLMLSPNQRIFIYQRKDRVGAGQPEVMVKAELLVNGTTVVRGTGGFVEYFHLLFDHHEIVFAEGLATESLPLDTRTSPALPKDIREKLGLAPKRRRSAVPRAVTLSEGMVDSATAAEILRKSSMR
jgi:hypothetical protein